MRTVGWFVALLLNAAVVAAVIPSVFEVAPPVGARVIGALVVYVFLSVVARLVLARLARLPQWGSKAMAYLCLSVPILWLLASLDLGTVSGLELWSIFLVVLLAWGTWHAFKLFPPKA